MYLDTYAANQGKFEITTPYWHQTSGFIYGGKTALCISPDYSSHNANGKIGIYDSTPSYTLDVTGDINATGEVRNSGSALSSDERLKENIADMDSMLSKVMELRPVTFDWKEDARGGRLNREEYRIGDFGFIAQEVSKLLPNMVSVGDDKEKLQGVSYAKLVSVLTKAVQELNQKVTDLEAELNKLK